jgi:hypothetical protein
MKTLKLFNKYFSLLEQDGVTPDPTETGTADPEQPQAESPEPTVEPLTSIAEQSYISLAARAFAYKPTDEQISSVNDALLAV